MNVHEKRIKLIKRSAITGKPVNAQESVSLGNESVFYSDAELPTVRVYFRDCWVLQTKNGTYVLIKHQTQNYYVAKDAPVKMHVILKPMGGEIIYWLKASVLKEAANG